MVLMDKAITSSYRLSTGLKYVSLCRGLTTSFNVKLLLAVITHVCRITVS